MIETLVVILIIATSLCGCWAVIEDIDRCCDQAMLDELWDEEPDALTERVQSYTGSDWDWADTLDEIRDLPEIVA
jgi:hypothetical protein